MSPVGPSIMDGGMIGGVGRRSSTASIDNDDDVKNSILQRERLSWQPPLPSLLRCAMRAKEDGKVEEMSYACSVEDVELLKSQVIAPDKWVSFESYDNEKFWETHQPLRIGIVLSGGQAPGGHNVISGVYDYVKRCHNSSQLFGFCGGPHGIFTNHYVEVTDSLMDKYRNLGGFDMICSGRHKIETEDQKKKTLQNCTKLDLDGLVIVGGDDSNTNAAIVAHYFQKESAKCVVVGCPKTIDGDLRNKYIEASFGFDTAIKTYSELIGNLCMDVATSGKYFHFVRLMGRSASHITLECAMQCRVNHCIIGEEVLAENKGLRSIVLDIVELIIDRSKIGKFYGVILLPEGLIEFIPEMAELIKELNRILVDNDSTYDVDTIKAKLSKESVEVFQFLPLMIREQLLLDRDPHGNVQVAMIATEKLLVLAVENELKLRKDFDMDKFYPRGHYFGYEGRCGIPSVFDATYCYALGQTAAALVDNKANGCMALLKKLNRPVEEWEPAGCPLYSMMQFEIRKGKPVPVITKFLVELDSPQFELFSKARKHWRLSDCYRCVGPIQFSGELAFTTNYTISLPSLKSLMPDKKIMEHNNFNSEKDYYFNKVIGELSEIEKQRLNSIVPINPIFFEPNLRLACAANIKYRDIGDEHATAKKFPLQTHESKNVQYNVESGVHDHRSFYVDNSSNPWSSGKPCEAHVHTVGIVLTGQQAPGVSNVLWGVYERLNLKFDEFKLLGFKGAKGLVENDYIEITQDDIKLVKNQGGFHLMGRSCEEEADFIKHIDQIIYTCKTNTLDGLVLLGGCWTMTDAVVLTEKFIFENIPTSVVSVPVTQNNNIGSRFIESTIGFDSASRCYSQIVGNLLTDSASAQKYWYFIRLMGRHKSHMTVEAALQTHANVTLFSEALAAGEKKLKDVINDVVDVIVSRSEMKKNYGAVLIPEGLVAEIPELNQLLSEIRNVALSSTSSSTDIANMFITMKDKQCKELLTPCSYDLLKTLPEFIRQQLVCFKKKDKPRRFDLTTIASEELVAHMVKQELAKRKLKKQYEGSFSPVCFYLGYQGRSCIPSHFDCSLGLAHGYLASIAIEFKLKGYATSMRALCLPIDQWKPCLFPISAIMTHTTPLQVLDKYSIDGCPMVQPEKISLNTRAAQKVYDSAKVWQTADRYCNPGPLQFDGESLECISKFLIQQHQHYLTMLNSISTNLNYIDAVCQFGTDEQSISTTTAVLEMLHQLLENQRKSPHAMLYPHITKAKSFQAKSVTSTLSPTPT